MPTITATPLPVYGWVRVELYWSDPAVTYARVDRVVPSTSDVSPLRPHTSYDGEYIRLSNGYALFYDTEAPLDTPFYYQAANIDEPLQVFPSPIQTPGGNGVVTDDFTRTVAAGATFGTSTSGHTYSAAGTTTQVSVNSTQGLIAVNGRDTPLGNTIDGFTAKNLEITAELTQSVVSTVAGNQSYFVIRRVDANNYYTVGFTWDTAGVLRLTLTKVVAGAPNSLGIINTGITYTANTKYSINIQVLDTTIRARAWLSSGTKPSGWLTSVTDYGVTSAGAVRFSTFSPSANTNALPITFGIDNLSITSYDTGVATTTTLSSEDGFWLRDPLIPCNDRRLVVCFDNVLPVCDASRGVFFSEMDDEVYRNRGGVVDALNRKLPISIGRLRGGVSSTMTLVSRTFADRDDLLTTMESGTPLLFSAPPAYGIADRYMHIEDVTVKRLFADHRNPIRVFKMPFVETEPPGGPAKGVCGARYEDLCDSYATWSAVIAAGKTYDDLITVV